MVQDNCEQQATTVTWRKGRGETVRKKKSRRRKQNIWERRRREVGGLYRGKKKVRRGNNQRKRPKFMRVRTVIIIFRILFCRA